MVPMDLGPSLANYVALIDIAHAGPTLPLPSLPTLDVLNNESVCQAHVNLHLHRGSWG